MTVCPYIAQHGTDTFRSQQQSTSTSRTGDPAFRGGLRDGSLVKFKVGEGGLVFDETGVPTSADLVYEGVASQKRQSADALTKIVFQYNARREPITIGEILGAVQRQSSS